MIKTYTLTSEDLLGRPLNDVEEKFAPKRLYVATGRNIPIDSPRFAIVGSRKATEKGKEIATEIASFLAKSKVVVVSGLAIGIDSAALAGAIESRGLTAAVIGTPLDKYYPAQNRELQKTMMNEHWVISQFAIGHPVQSKNFVIRNRTMALVSDASIIVEAGESSGSLHQGWEALRLGRPLFLWRSIVEDQSLKWPKKMMDYGAIELQSPEEILDALPSPNRSVQIVI